MKQLVFMSGKRIMTDSLLVAEVFDKEHKRVMQDIRDLDCSEEFSRHNFVPSDYTSDRGKTYPKVDMTRDGFTFLAMGYTGHEAARFKELYIGEFNRMEAELTNSTPSLASVEQLLGNPEFGIRLLTTIKEEREARKEAEAIIAEQKPLVGFAEICLKSDDSVMVRDYAHSLSSHGIKTGEKKLYKKFREWGFICKKSTEPTQRAVNQGLFEVVQGKKEMLDGGVLVYRTPYVTVKGQVYFTDRLRQEELVG